MISMSAAMISESFETVNPTSCLALNAGLQAATNSSKAQTKHHPRQVAESSLGSSLEGLYLSLEPWEAIKEGLRNILILDQVT